MKPRILPQPGRARLVLSRVLLAPVILASDFESDFESGTARAGLDTADGLCP
jgi:hypothetical protein